MCGIQDGAKFWGKSKAGRMDSRSWEWWKFKQGHRGWPWREDLTKPSGRQRDPRSCWELQRAVNQLEGPGCRRGLCRVQKWPWKLGAPAGCASGWCKEGGSECCLSKPGWETENVGYCYHTENCLLVSMSREDRRFWAEITFDRITSRPYVNSWLNEQRWDIS